MATAPISLLQLTNASLDADDLDVVVNGDENATTVNRAGNTLPSIAKWLSDAEDQLSQALINAGVFATVADGVAGSGEGAYFLVPSSQDGAFFDLYRKTGGVGVFTGKSSPSSAFVLDSRPTSGELFDEFVPFAEIYQGAEYEYDSNGRIIGLQFNQGSSGAFSSFAPLLYLPAGVAEKIAGKSFDLTAIFDATAGFNDDWVMDFARVFAIRPSGLVKNEGTLIERTQVGTTLTYRVRYTPTDQDIAFGPALQRQYTDNYPTGSIRLRSLVFVASIDASTDGSTGADTALALRAGLQNADVVARVTPLPADIYNESVDAFVTLANGATSVSVDGRPRGWTIPIGSTGNGTTYALPLPVPFSRSSVFAGARVEIEAVMNVTENYPHPYIGMVMQSVNPNRSYSGQEYRSEKISPTQQRITSVFTLVGDEVTLRPFLRNDVATTSSEVRTATLAQMSMRIIESAAPGYSEGTLNAMWTRLANTQPPVKWTRKVVKANGTVGVDCDYTSLVVALDNLADGSPSNRYKLEVRDGFYDYSNMGRPYLGLRNWVDIVGQSRGGTVIITRHPTFDSANATFDAAFYGQHIEHASLQNLTAVCYNGKGPFHADSPVWGRGKIEVENVDLINENTIGMPHYQVNIACGLNQGQYVSARNCRGNGIMYAHSNQGSYFSPGCGFEVIGCMMPWTLIGDLLTRGFDYYRIIGCTLEYILYSVNSLGVTTTNLQPSFTFDIYGNQIDYVDIEVLVPGYEGQNGWDAAFGGKIGVTDTSIHTYKRATSAITRGGLVALDNSAPMGVKPWTPGARLYGVALENLSSANNFHGVVQYSGTVFLTPDQSPAPQFDDEIEINSAGHAAKRTTGRLVGYARGYTGDGTRIKVKLAA